MSHSAPATDAGQSATRTRQAVANPGRAACRNQPGRCSRYCLCSRFGDLAGLLAGGRYPDDGSEVDDDSTRAIDLVIAGIHQLVRDSPAPEADESTPELTPAQQLAVAEAELDAVLALRKQAQQRMKELERRVRDAPRTRNRAKERAKAAR